MRSGGGTYSGSRRSKEDQCPEVGRPLVAQSASSVDQSTDAISLDGRAGERRAPASSSGGSLAALEELLLRVGGLGLLVGIAEDGAEDGERDGVVVDCA